MNLINGISLITAFFGGMVALFAPCCITYLLPSYLANIFRSRRNVVFMTGIFGLGIATILVPTALGIRAIGNLFQAYHTETYIIGGIFMILLGAMELTGRKITIPMLNLSIDFSNGKNPWTIYVLGVFSGITSSCCTPVLAGILTLSFLSPSFLWAGLAGIAYVTGMVIPLVVLSLLLERVDWLKIAHLKGKAIHIGDKKIPVTEAIAGVIFILVGILFSALALSGNIDMGTRQPLEQSLGTSLLSFVRLFQSISGSEYLFAALIIGIIISLFIRGRRNL